MKVLPHTCLLVDMLETIQEAVTSLLVSTQQCLADDLTTPADATGFGYHRNWARFSYTVYARLFWTMKCRPVMHY